MTPSGRATLVTGAAGFIGRRLTARLEAEGDKVVPVDRAQVDLSNPGAVERLLSDLRPERLVHLAASLDRRSASDAIEAQWRDTFEAGRNVILGARAAGVRHLMVPGSIEELGSQAGVLTPDLPTAPVTVYGLCKSLLREIAGFGAAGGQMRVDWFRPFIVYGPGQRGSMVIPAAFEAASSGTPADFSDGLQERDFVFVDDLIAWLVEGLHADVGRGAGQLVVQHLGSGEPMPVRHVLELIAGQFPSSDFRLGALPRRSHEPALQVSGPNPVGQPWTWRPETPIQEGIRRTADWWRGTAPAT